MSHVSLDAFQLLVACYLFFTAAKGSGTLYNFPEVPKKKQEPLRQLLRKIYASGGVIALLDGCVSMLQNTGARRSLLIQMWHAGSSFRCSPALMAWKP